MTELSNTRVTLAGMGDYHKLEVWHLASALADDIAALVAELPDGRTSAMGDQITRAADSIHQNISEGSGFDSDRQFAKYLRQARGSADEVQDDLETLARRGLLAARHSHLATNAKLIAKKLSRLINALEARKS
jgi:four helix bundle protein